MLYINTRNIDIFLHGEHLEHCGPELCPHQAVNEEVDGGVQ